MLLVLLLELLVLVLVLVLVLLLCRPTAAALLPVAVTVRPHSAKSGVARGGGHSTAPALPDRRLSSPSTPSTSACRSIAMASWILRG